MKYSIKGLAIALCILFLLVGTVFAASQGWVFSIKFSDTNSRTVSSEEFLADYGAYLLLQSELSGLDDSLVSKLLANKQKRKEYSELMLNHLLVIEFVKERNLVNFAQVDAKVKRISAVLRKMIIVKEFMKKVIEPKVTPATADEIREFYNKYKNNAEFRQRVQGMNTTQVRTTIGQILHNRQKQVLLQRYLTRFRERSIIKMNDSYFQ